MTDIRQLLSASRAASRRLASLTRADKDRALLAMADALEKHLEALLTANQKDMDAARKAGISPAMQDRLLLNSERISSMADALRAVAKLPDPVGEIRDEKIMDNGIRVAKMRVPLGVIAMIFEARPNVVAEAAALTLKSGNAIVLRPGSEAFHSSQAIAELWRAVLISEQLPAAAVSVLPTRERSAMLELLQQDDLVDLVIPRGGEGLIRFVAENSRIPVIRHYKGVCHLYVDRDAEPRKAVDLLIDGKTSRPGVCNALESLLVHQAIAQSFFALAAQRLADKQVEVRGCEKTLGFLPEAKMASDEDFAAEFLAPIISVKVVADVEEAIAHIARFGSQHTEVIVSENTETAERFLREVDASAVMVNASSRFNDGGCLGLGAEIGIATTKLHAYGPMGLSSLTTEKFIVRGEGQTRHPVN